MATLLKKKGKEEANSATEAKAMASERPEEGSDQGPPTSATSSSKASLFGWFSAKKGAALTPAEQNLLEADNRKKILRQWREDSKNLEERMEVLEKKMNSINLQIYQCLNTSGQKPVPIVSERGRIQRLRVKLNLCKHEHTLLLHEFYETQLASTNARYSAIADPTKETYQEKVRASSSAVSTLKSKMMNGKSSDIFDNNVRVAELREELHDSAAEFDSMMDNQRADEGNDEDFFQSVVQCARELQQNPSAATVVTAKKTTRVKMDASATEVKKPVKVKRAVNPEVDVEAAILSAKLDQVKIPTSVSSKSSKGSGGQTAKVPADKHLKNRRQVVEEAPISIVPNFSNRY
jgi:hypothetical protein